MDSNMFREAIDKVNRLASENKRIAVHACLPAIFHAAFDAHPRVIVELGVSKEALANKVLSMVAELHDAQMVSMDIGNFNDVCAYKKWMFVQGDARDFAKAMLPHNPFATTPIDVLLIDTDELYETTRTIWEAWNPWLASGATVIFRCTNLRPTLVYADGTVTPYGWDNKRGVIRVVEEIMGVQSIDESRAQSWTLNGWHLKHIPWGAGLTVLRRKSQC